MVLANQPPRIRKIGDTGLAAIQQNVMAASFQREKVLKDLKKGIAGGTSKVDMPFIDGVPLFLEWYRGEHRDHPNTGKRATGSMASLGLFLGQTLCRNISSGQLDNFKTWRRKSGVADEVMKMRKCDIRDGTHMYVYGKSKASKRWLLMEKETAGILLPRLNLPGDWLFPSDSPLNRGGHIMTLQLAHDDVLEQTGLTFNIYDFRHTFATRKAIGPPPMPLPVLAALMGHANTASLHKYIHPFQHLMDEAMRGTPSQQGAYVVDAPALSSITGPSQLHSQLRHSFCHSSVTVTRSKKEHKGALVAPKRGRPPKQ